MIPNGDLGKGFGLRASLELDKRPECQPTGSPEFSAPQTPACHVSLDNLVRLKIAPSVLDAVARKMKALSYVDIR
jgi:hypothetical protein